MQFSYEYEGQTLQITLEDLGQGRYEARIGERSYSFAATPLAEGGYLLKLGQQQIRVMAAAQDEQRFLHMGGQHYQLSTVDSRRRRRGTNAGSGDLTAQMPGQIRELRVQVGDTVSSGQLLLVMEAMNMEMRITAPAEGSIAQVLVQPGDVVERGQRLIEIRPLTQAT